MDLVLVSLSFNRVIEIDGSPSSESADHVPYDFVTGTVHGYPAEKIVR